MSKIQFDVDVADSAAIDVDNDLLPVWWMEVNVCIFRINQSKSLLHADIKWLSEMCH